jgi:hypothetical protein
MFVDRRKRFMKFEVGSLVRAKSREWIVLPGSIDNVLFLRPCIGTDNERTIILPDLESVTPATFGLPNPEYFGDLNSAGYLLDAARFGIRSSTGPYMPLPANANRCGVIATDQVTEITVLFLVRSRYQIETYNDEQLAGDVFVAGFSGNLDFPAWLSTEDSEKLLQAKASENYSYDRARGKLKQILEHVDTYLPELTQQAEMRANSCLVSIRRVRADMTGVQATKGTKIQGTPDILGIFVLYPVRTS